MLRGQDFGIELKFGNYRGLSPAGGACAGPGRRGSPWLRVLGTVGSCTPTAGPGGPTPLPAPRRSPLLAGAGPGPPEPRSASASLVGAPVATVLGQRGPQRDAIPRAPGWPRSPPARSGGSDRAAARPRGDSRPGGAGSTPSDDARASARPTRDALGAGERAAVSRRTITRSARPHRRHGREPRADGGRISPASSPRRWAAAISPSRRRSGPRRSSPAPTRSGTCAAGRRRASTSTPPWPTRCTAAPRRRRRKGATAVEATRGRILTYGGAPIDAFFYSTCGGRTADGTEVFRAADRPYLRSVADVADDGTAYCSISPRFRWHEEWTGEALRATLQRTLPPAAAQAPPRGRRAARCATCGSPTAPRRDGSGSSTIGLRRGDVRVDGPSVRQVLRPAVRRAAAQQHLHPDRLRRRAAGSPGSSPTARAPGTASGSASGAPSDGPAPARTTERILAAYYPGAHARASLLTEEPA